MVVLYSFAFNIHFRFLLTKHLHLGQILSNHNHISIHLSITRTTMMTEWYFIILALLFVNVIKADQIIIVNYTDFEPNYEFINGTAELKVGTKSNKYGINIDVEVRKEVENLLVCIFFCIFTVSFKLQNFFLGGH